MTNLPKELEEIMVNDAQTFFGDDGAFYQSGFNACYQSMLNTYVPKEKVLEIFEAIKIFMTERDQEDALYNVKMMLGIEGKE